jgi:hypothetical protein
VVTGNFSGSGWLRAAEEPVALILIVLSGTGIAPFVYTPF